MGIGDAQISRRGLLLGGLGLATSASLLTACGPSSSDGSSGSGGDEGSATKGNLVVWGAVDPALGPQNLIDAFMKKYPDINVKYEKFVNDEEGILKLDAALTGGVPIDVFFSYGLADMVRRSEAGLALDLTELASADENLKAFTQGDPLSTKIDGKLFSIPTTHFPLFVILNEDAMKKAGIEVPFDWTVADYRQTAQALTAAGFNPGAYNAPRLAAATLGGDYLYKNDGAESNFDHPVFREELEMLLAMEDEGSILTQERITAEGIGGYAQNYFFDGTFGMFFDGTNTIRFGKNTAEYPHDFRMTFRPYPAPVAGEPYFNPGVRGDEIQISAKSKYPAAAWTFVQFWSGEGAPLLAPAGKITPAEYANRSDELFPNLFGENPDKLFDVESFEKTFFAAEPPLSVRNVTKGFTEINKMKTEIDAEVRLRTKSVDDAIAELKQKADEAIAKAA